MEQMGEFRAGQTHQSLLKPLWPFVSLFWLRIETRLYVNSKTIWVTPGSEWLDRVQGEQRLVIVKDDI